MWKSFLRREQLRSTLEHTRKGGRQVKSESIVDSGYMREELLYLFLAVFVPARSSAAVFKRLAVGVSKRACWCSVFEVRARDTRLRKSAVGSMAGIGSYPQGFMR